MAKLFTSLCMALTFLLPISVFAMKPAPFENRDYVNETTQFRLISKLKAGVDGYSTEGTTQLKDRTGKVLWSIPVFVGRREASISPDGKAVILSGNIYFGGLFQPSRDEVMATVFTEGKSTKNILFSDIFPEDPEMLVRNLNVSVFGGGWVDTHKFIKNEIVDWAQRTINFTLYNNEVKKITF